MIGPNEILGRRVMPAKVGPNFHSVASGFYAFVQRLVIGFDVAGIVAVVRRST